jgi:hypothetical protein
MQITKQRWRMLLLLGMLLLVHNSEAVIWPKYCQQSGGTVECDNTNFKQVSLYSCDLNPTFATTSADECYAQWTAKRSERVSAINAPDVYVFIPVPDDKRDVLTPYASPYNGSANLQTFASGCGNFGCPYSYIGMKSTPGGSRQYTQGAIPPAMMHVDYACPVGWNIRTLPDANNPYISTFNPRIGQPNIICTRTPPACPPHAHPVNLPSPPCECDTGYVWDATGTQCLPEKFKLELNSPAGDIEPSATAAGDANSFKTMSVLVKGEKTGLPKNGAVVRVTLEVQQNSGGHDHHDAQRPKGELINAPRCTAVAAIAGSYDCTTGTDGLANFTFKSTQVSGTHFVIASCTAPTCVNNLQTAAINVKVPELSEIPASPYYGFKTPNSDTNHPYTYFLKPEFSGKVRNIAMFYYWNTYFMSKNGVIPDFVLTEGSLKWGGVLDCFLTCDSEKYPSTPWNKHHVEHRRGSVVDVRANGTPGSIVYDAKFRRIALREGVDVGNLHGSGSGLHYHLRLNNDTKE